MWPIRCCNAISMGAAQQFVYAAQQFNISVILSCYNSWNICNAAYTPPHEFIEFIEVTQIFVAFCNYLY